MTVYEQLIEEGRQKGLRQGIEKGRTQGCAKMLLDQLVAKFGSVPAGVRDRIQQAGEGELGAWATRVLTAATLEDALGPVTASPAARRAPRPRR